MQATDILMEEHRVIERVLASLEAAAKRLEEGQAVRVGFFLDTADFVKGFADNCHHKKEEGVLFKALVDRGMPQDGGPVGVMLMEHEQGRGYTRAMRQAAQRLAAGEDAARGELIRNARSYTALLRQHIAKEEGILFSLADEFIPPSEHAKIVEGFEHVEHEDTGEGVHEKYLALATALEQEARG
jgi:hemerythrin-like domain-containing protein